MIYGKIADGIFRPLPITYTTDEGVTISNFNALSEEEWGAHGFLPVETSAPPDSLNVYEPMYGLDIKGEAIIITGWRRKPSEVSAQALTAMFKTAAEDGGIDDATVYANASVFEDWTADFTGRAGCIRQYAGKLYKNFHEITNSAQNGKPSESPTIWYEIPDPSNEWPDWIPYGGVVLYNTGSKVSHNGRKWVSTVDNNVWEPGVAMWEEVI